MTNRPSSKTRLAAPKAAAVAISLIGGAEGLRTYAYPDPATGREPWTACYGETEGIRKGMTFTVEQCKEMLRTSLVKYAVRIEACVPALADPAKTSPERYASQLSLAYNIGWAGYCKSSVARLINAGEALAACDFMLKFNRAAGVVMKGLTRRRTQERELCRVAA